MIIVKLMGGLGNQLFQYAMARHLAIKHKTELKVDITGLHTKALSENGTVRELELNKMGLNLDVASSQELEAYQKGKAGKMLDLLFLPVGLNKLYIRERHFEFYSKALTAPKDCYLDGYWQSENYFSMIREELLKELRPSELSSETKELAKQLCEGTSVSIHVRKGDYISIPLNRDIYAICGEKYYKAAIDKMNAAHRDCTFYVFSDEPEWFRRNVGDTPQVKYVTHNSGKDSYQDLYLMSLCKHNIIANSSFSWWGAWLNMNEGKTVIAPKHWFKSDSKNTKDLIPASWIRL